MPVLQGACPNCGSPTEFSVGSSISKVCPFCRHVIVRTDRDLQNLGKAADLAATPSTLGVGDRGSIRGRAFEVLGRVQLDYGRGPWDEFYVGYADGTWGWVAEAQGNLYATSEVREPLNVPPAPSLRVEMPVQLGRFGVFKVTEIRTARVLTAEGELPMRPAPQRFYADLAGPNEGFATLDYGDGSKAVEVFVGVQIPRAEVQVTPSGRDRPAEKAQLANITCPNCGGALPAPSDPAIERIACRYCNTISESRSLQIIARQQAAYSQPKIPLGSKANLAGTNYIVIGFVIRNAQIEGELFRWNEYLLYGDNVGFRWLVEDEGNWIFVRGINAAEVNPGGSSVGWHGRYFSLRNQNQARVEYVVGEFYWKVEVGETVQAADYINGGDVLSREEGDGEVQWSYGQPTPWSRIAQAFGLNPALGSDATPWAGGGYSSGSASSSGGAGAFAWIIPIAIVLVCIVCVAVSDGGGGSGGGYSSGYSSSGSGFSFSSGGGGSSFGGFGGK